jgi:hypothetical protein
MFRQLRVHTPAPLTPDGQRAAEQAAETFAVSYTPAERRGGQASASLEPGAATGPEATLGAPSAAMNISRAPSYDSATNDDLRRCARCGEQHVSTVMGTPPSSQIHPSTSPHPNLELQCQDPFWPTAWRGLTSIVRKPQRWQLTSSAPLKTTKIPARSSASIQLRRRRNLAYPRRGAWTRPSRRCRRVGCTRRWRSPWGSRPRWSTHDRYQMLDAPLTCRKRRASRNR